MAEADTVSGPEDPRAIRTSADGEVYVFVAVWESTKVQWQHMLRVRGSVDLRMEVGLPLHPRRPSINLDDPRSASTPLDHTRRPSITPLDCQVDARHRLALRPWLAQLGMHHEQRLRIPNLREKNWSPFEWRGQLYVEYAIEPRLVLALDTQTGVGTPLLPMSSSPAVRAWVDKLGPVSGGAPAVELRALGIYLGLAHVKLFKKKGAKTATSKMMYKHFWCAEDRLPLDCPSIAPR